MGADCGRVRSLNVYPRSGRDLVHWEVRPAHVAGSLASQLVALAILLEYSSNIAIPQALPEIHVAIILEYSSTDG